MDFDQENDIIFWANIDLLKVRKGTLGKGLKYVQSNNKNTRTTLWRRSGVFIVNFEDISHLFLVFLLLNLNKYMLAGLFLLIE